MITLASLFEAIATALPLGESGALKTTASDRRPSRRSRREIEDARQGGAHPYSRASVGFAVGASRRRKMAKRKGPSAPSSSRARKKAANEGRGARVDHDAREAEDAKLLLDKLPPEIWEKVLRELEENDFSPWL